MNNQVTLTLSKQQAQYIEEALRCYAATEAPNYAAQADCAKLADYVAEQAVAQA